MCAAVGVYVIYRLLVQTAGSTEGRGSVGAGKADLERLHGLGAPARRRSPAICVAGSRREREEWEWRVDGVAASHKYYFYAGAAPSPQHRPRSLLFADLSIAARRSLSIKRFQWPGVRRSEAFR